MLIHAFRHERLMEESELRVQMSLHLHSPADTVASRVLDCPESYRRWEAEHGQLMRAISAHGRRDGQVTALRNTLIGLVHRRA